MFFSCVKHQCQVRCYFRWSLVSIVTEETCGLKSRFQTKSGNYFIATRYQWLSIVDNNAMQDNKRVISRWRQWDKEMTRFGTNVCHNEWQSLADNKTFDYFSRLSSELVDQCSESVLRQSMASLRSLWSLKLIGFQIKSVSDPSLRQNID